MLTRPPATNTRVLIGSSLITGLMSLSFVTGDHVEVTTALLLFIATGFTLAAAWRPYAALVFAGFGILTIAFASRAMLGQLQDGLEWQNRLRLLTVWSLLAVGSWRRADQAKHIIRDESP